METLPAVMNLATATRQDSSHSHSQKQFRQAYRNGQIETGRQTCTTQSRWREQQNVVGGRWMFLLVSEYVPSWMLNVQGQLRIGMGEMKALRGAQQEGEQKECSRVEVEDTLHIWLLCQWKGKRDKSAGAGRRSFRRRNPASSTFLLPLTKLKLSTVTCKWKEGRGTNCLLRHHQKREKKSTS